MTTSSPDDERGGTGSRQAERAAVAEVLADGTLRIDLTDPPSREDLALPPGRTSIPLEADEGTVEVVVTTANDPVLAVPADTVFVSAPDGSSPPEEVVVLRRGLTDEELRDVVDTAVLELGVDPVAGDLALRDISGDLASDTSRVLDTQVASPATIQVEVGRTALEGRGSVYYHLSWS
ncbi:hypothetical protein [Pseudokineococcus sp. 1T1Z-3]|uniref:hypothetical protein n=1 Tax=Pseudokineococcus sp. 1T1Z-3 TaxID=3132745 RepID=UPI0030B62F3F